MLFFSFTSPDKSEHENLTYLFDYISKPISLKETPSIEKDATHNYYVNLSNEDSSALIEYNKEHPSSLFSLHKSNLQTWMTKRKPVTYEYDFSKTKLEELRGGEEKKDAPEEKKDALSETTETKTKNNEEPITQVVQTIVENKYSVMCKEECYNRLCTTSRKTLPFMTKYEKTRLLCIRAQQLANGAQILVDVPLDKKNNIDFIVRKELKNKKLPLIVRRYLPNGTFEDWKAHELNIIH